MSNYDDIKKKIQSLKNKKPDNNISDNLNRIEMEINKDTLSLFKKNNDQQRSNNLLSEITLDNNNTNFVTNSLLAPDQSFLYKTLKKDNVEFTSNVFPKEPIITNLKEDVLKEKKDDIVVIENNEVSSKNRINTINEIYSKSNNSDEMNNKNKINVNNIDIPMNGKKEFTKEYLSNELITKPTAKTIYQEKSTSSLRREKTQNENNNIERKANSGVIKVEEMWKMLEIKTSEKEKILKQKDSGNIDEFFSINTKVPQPQSSLTTIQKIQKETAEIYNLSSRSNLKDKANTMDIGNKLRDKIFTLVKHLDKEPEKTKNRKYDLDNKFNDNKNMLIINNNFEFEASSKNNYNTGINNYISPKPKLELMTDKFFGTKFNNKSSFNASDPSANTRSIINNNLLIQKKENVKSEDTSPLEMNKLKLNWGTNVSECSIENTFKLEDIKSLSLSLKYMNEENLRKLNPM